MPTKVKGKKRPGLLKSYFTPSFSRSIGLASRAAFGVLLAGMLQTKNEDGDPALVPSFYNLDGLSYAAVMVVFSTSTSLGGTLRATWQGFIGVIIALIYNIILFSIVSPTRESLVTVTLTLSGEDYNVSQTDVSIFLPCLILFTLVITVAPFQTGTKKFAVGINAYIILYLINPNNEDLIDFEVSNIMQNFAFYILIGVAGSVIAILTMFVPTPLLATSLLRTKMKILHLEIEELVNTLLDSYSIEVSQQKLVRKKLERKFKKATGDYESMVELLDHVWWEQLVGVAHILKFNKSVAKQYVELYRRLLATLRAMQDALLWEDELRSTRQALRQDIYKVQRSISFVLREIISKDDFENSSIELKTLDKLSASISELKKHHEALELELFRNNTSVKSTLGFNVMLFHLVAFHKTLKNFEKNFKAQRDTKNRVTNFVRKELKSSLYVHRCCNEDIKAGIKITLAVTIACFPAIYIYEFSSTAPSTIAVVMGTNFGGSFRSLSNRLIGVVSGSIIPSIFIFFICNFESTYLQNGLNNLVLFGWTTGSMYVYFNPNFFSYAGVVSAFIAAQAFLDGCPVEAESNESGIGTYTSLVQTSMGILIFILIELMVLPRRAVSLLRLNVKNSLSQLHRSFKGYYGYYTKVSSSDIPVMEEESELTLEAVRSIVNVESNGRLEKIQQLIAEAEIEPTLWRAPFPAKKFRSVLKLLRRIRYSLSLWDSIITCQDSGGVNVRDEDCWSYLKNDFTLTIQDAFDKLLDVFSVNLSRHYNAEEDAVLYLEMKEAFRVADADGSGRIDASELKTWLENTLDNTVVNQEGIQKIVDQFMKSSSDNQKTISLTQFMDAIEKDDVIDVKIFSKISADIQAAANRMSNDDLFLEISTTLENAAQVLREEYSDWIQKTYNADGNNDGENMASLEDLLAISCFVTGACDITKALLELQQLLLTE